MNKKCFFSDFTLLCENFSKIGPIIKKWGGPQGVQILHFSMFISLFIHLIYSYFQILLVYEEC